MSKNKQLFMISIFLAVVTLAVFWQVNHSDFIFFDDPDYVTSNNHVQNGITVDGIRWAFTTGHAANWHPLTWVSHMLDVQLFGLTSRWHHLANLLFHSANSVLLFFVLYRMTKARWESAFVAALFALHPLHVESVAWLAERKDVLSAFFWILTMGAYCRYVEHPRPQSYLIVVLFFVAGLMAKPMLVTLPFVLLLLDYWPLRRFQQKSAQKIRKAEQSSLSGGKQKGKSKRKPVGGEEVAAEMPADSRFHWALMRPLLWEKIPLFALTVLSSIITYLVQEQGGMVKSIKTFPLSVRLENALVSYITYIGNALWPSKLAFLYPYQLLLPAWKVIGAVLFLIAVTSAVVWKAKRNPYLAVGWLWYIGTLVPVIGIVQVGLQARADRYTYIPLIGLFIMLTWGISKFSKNWRHRREVLVASSAAILLCLSLVTWSQVRHWQNNIALLDRALTVTKNNYLAYYNRGTDYANRGNNRQAIADYDKAVEINPNFELGYYNRGTSYFYLGNYMQAIGDFDKAVEIFPNYEEAYFNRSSAYTALGNLKQAIMDYDKVIEINPKNAGAFFNRGNAYSRLGNFKQAIGDYDKAVEINPNFEIAYFSRGGAYAGLGNFGQSNEDLKTAARLGYREAQNLLKNRGMEW